MRPITMLGALALATLVACGAASASGLRAPAPALPPLVHNVVVDGLDDDGTLGRHVLQLTAFTGRYGRSCSGTLVTPRVVLSAGHCLINRQASRREGTVVPFENVVVSVPRENGRPRVVEAAHTVIHPDYLVNLDRRAGYLDAPMPSARPERVVRIPRPALKPDGPGSKEDSELFRSWSSQRNVLRALGIFSYPPNAQVDDARDDLALIFLKDPVEAFAPLRMGALGPSISSETPLLLAGFGLTARPDVGDNPPLTYAPYFIVSTFRTDGGFPELAIIFPDEFRRASYGDSGGPVIAKEADGTMRVIGVTSSASRVGLVYAVLVEPMIPWIRAEIVSRPEFLSETSWLAAL